MRVSVSPRAGNTEWHQQGTLFKQSRDDALDERDLRVFKPLKAPAVEFQAEDIIGVCKAGLDHFKDTGLPHAPVPVHADRDGLGLLITKQLDDRCRDRFVVEQVNACFIVGKDHRRPSARRARQISASPRRSISASRLTCHRLYQPWLGADSKGRHNDRG
jgi:hypothetical protein